MTKLSLIVLGFISFSHIGTVIQAGEDFKIIFEGSFECKTRNVKFSSGELAKQEFSNLDAAQDALNRVYVSKGVAEFVGLLKDVCEDKEQDERTHLGPRQRNNGPATAEYRKPGSLITFVKKGELVNFKVLGFESELPAGAVAERYAVNKDKDRCRKISSTCWKCPDGIICSMSQIAR